MRPRTLARECALQLLYEADIRQEEPDKLWQDFWQAKRAEIPDAVKEFTTQIVKGAYAKIPEIDPLLAKYADNWTISRMGIIDRNVMRMATYELLYCPDIPPKVAINEAIDLAKKFGDSESGKFVNGILDKINKTEARRG